MSGRICPDFSELAYHITILCDFWKRSGSPERKDNLMRILRDMIGISLGLEKADSIARAVVTELDVLGVVRTDQEVDPEGIDVIFITELLREEAGVFAVPAEGEYGS